MTANERTCNGNNKTRTHSSYTEKKYAYIFSTSDRMEYISSLCNDI